METLSKCQTVSSVVDSLERVLDLTAGAGVAGVQDAVASTAIVTTADTSDLWRASLDTEATAD
jgi:predicted nicotinamide N-methyase